MSALTLVKTRLQGGVWEGVLTGSKEPPQIEVTHLQQTIDSVELSSSPVGDGWVLRITIPAELISDGVQSFLIWDAAAGEVLESFAMAAGDALSQDIRAEMAALRDELDMLKRSFRRHCVETT